MAEFEVGDKVRIIEENIKGIWLERFKKRHPRKDGIHKVTAKLGINTYVLDNDDNRGMLPCLFVGRWLQSAEKRSPKFKVGDMVRVLDGEDIENYTDGWCMGGHIGHIFEIEKIVDFKDGRFGYKPKGDFLTYDERGLELAKGVHKDPSCIYIIEEKSTSKEGEIVPTAEIQKLLDDIGQKIEELRKTLNKGKKR